MPTCKVCSHAQWELTAAGQIKRKVAGKCAAPITISAPSCAKVLASKTAIWPDGGLDCRLFQAKDKSI